LSPLRGLRLISAAMPLVNLRNTSQVLRPSMAASLQGSASCLAATVETGISGCGLKQHFTSISSLELARALPT